MTRMNGIISDCLFHFLMDCLLISALLVRCACEGLLSAPHAAHDKFPLTPLFEYKEQTELLGLTQIDGVQVLPRLGLFNFNDTWLPEENTDNIKRLDQRLEASSSLGNLERVRERSLKNLAKRRNPWLTRCAKIIIRNALTLTLIRNTRVSDENIMALTPGACKTLWLWC